MDKKALIVAALALGLLLSGAWGFKHFQPTLDQDAQREAIRIDGAKFGYLSYKIAQLELMRVLPDGDRLTFNPPIDKHVGKAVTSSYGPAFAKQDTCARYDHSIRLKDQSEALGIERGKLCFAMQPGVRLTVREVGRRCVRVGQAGKPDLWAPAWALVAER